MFSSSTKNVKNFLESQSGKIEKQFVHTGKQQVTHKTVSATNTSRQ